MKKFLFILLYICLLFSCSGTRRGLTTYGEWRIIEASYDRLFNATKEYFNECGYKFLKTKYETGEIETDFRPLKMAGMYGRKERLAAKVIQIDSANTKLAIDFLIEARDSVSGLAYSTGGANVIRIDRFYEAITAKAQRRPRK